MAIDITAVLSRLLCGRGCRYWMRVHGIAHRSTKIGTGTAAALVGVPRFANRRGRESESLQWVAGTVLVPSLRTDPGMRRVRVLSGSANCSECVGGRSTRKPKN